MSNSKVVRSLMHTSVVMIVLRLVVHSAFRVSEYDLRSRSSGNDSGKRTWL